MLLRFFDGYGAAKLCAGADHKGHFQLKIELAAGTEGRRGFIRGFALAVRPLNGGARYHDAAGAAVVADGQVPPVGQQGVGWVAEHGTHVGGVFDAAVEIGVIGGLHRAQHSYLGLTQEAVAYGFLVVAQFRGIVAQQLAHALTHCPPCRLPESQEGIE